VADGNNNAIRKIDLDGGANGGVTTFAGSPPRAGGLAGQSGTTDANGTAARFNLPAGIFYSDKEDCLYIGDFNNNSIRKITDLDGVAKVTTVATGTGSTTGFAMDAAGNIYFAAFGANTVRMIRSGTTNIVTIAGTSNTAGFAEGSNNSTIGKTAQFRNPYGIAVTADGKTIYVSDYNNHRIRVIKRS
jgi:DNA-binding beta-propeller fold protein YncE